MTAMLFTLPKQRLFDANANPLAGAKVYIFDAGTTTPKTTYTDRARTIAHTHPIVADTDGYVAAIYPPDGTYKITVADSADVVQWTLDDQQGPLDLSSFSSGGAGVTETVDYESTTHSQSSTDYGKVWLCDATGGSFDFNVPSAVSQANKQFTVANVGTANRVAVKQFGAETVDGAASVTLYPGEVIRLTSDGANLIRISPLVHPVGTPRQTAISGPTYTSGVIGGAAFLPATSVNLDLTTANITDSVPLVVSAAYGASRRGNLDRVGIATSNLTWTGLTPSATCYLYVDIGTDGQLTTGHTTLQPDYNWGGTYPVTSGQFTYNIQDAIGKVGNGSAATQVYRVFLGDATTTGSAVASSVAYAYQGRHTTPLTTLFAAGNRQPYTHNIGVLFVQAELWLRCATPEAGYSANQYTRLQGNGVGQPLALEDRNSASHMVSASNNVFHRSTGVMTAITAANWQTIVRFNRGW